MDWDIQQHTPDTLPDGDWDVAVVGAGPAGAICALALARAGRRCLLIDQARFPRHKACGDLLLHDAQEELDRVDLLSAVRSRSLEVKTIRVYSPSGVDYDVPGRYLTIRRIDLDAAVARAAVQSGAVCLQATVNGVAEERDGVSLGLSHTSRRIRARYAVLATGAADTEAGRLGLIAQELPDGLAIRRYVQSDMPLDYVILSYDRALVPGYGWIVPLGDRTFNVGCGVTLYGHEGLAVGLKDRLDRFLGKFAPAQELMRVGRFSSPVRGGALRCGLSGFNRSAARRVLAAGEVIGTTFPFTGEGVGQAMASGRLAAQALARVLSGDSDDPAELYGALVEQDLRPSYRGYAAAQKWLSRPWLNDFVARRIRRSEYLRKEVAAFQSAAGSPRRLFSVRSLLKSFWS